MNTREQMVSLIMLARFPVPGEAKTRLIPALGSVGAARLHRRLTEHAVAVARLARDIHGLNVTVCGTGGKTSAFRSWLGPDLQYRQQAAGDLGRRLCRAVDDAFAAGATRVLAMGTDVPDTTAGILGRAAAMLASHDVVLGRAEDGGYYLIGLNGPHPELFAGIDWGSGQVADQTCSAIRKLGLSLGELPTLGDVDRPDDLAELRENPIVADVLTGLPLLSVIVPTLNEAGVIGSTLARAKCANGVELIVADGGSVDGTRQIAARSGARVLETRAGRAAQMNAGASSAQGRILVFLHADTLLPDQYEDRIRTALERPEVVAGAFRLRTDGAGWAMRLMEWGANLRSTLLGLPYGDQALFLEKRVFQEMGGFAGLPIMEDFDLVRRLGRRGKVTILEESVMTSFRRWRRLGVLRTLVRNQLVVAGFLAGISPQRLARFYHSGKSEKIFAGSRESRV